MLMRAAVVTGPQQFEIVEIPIPEPGGGEVRVKLAGCGVCGSNLPVWQGQPWTQYPLEPGAIGHEGWGWIDALGDGVAALAVGQRVVALSSHAYAEYDIAKANQVIVIPPTLGEQPLPGEPLGCAMNVFRRSGIQAGQTVAIIGIGFLGALLTNLAANAGARVIAISRRAFALEVARNFGASETIPMNDHWQIIERVRQLTDGTFCDQVIEAVGQQWPLDLAAELTRERGRLIIAGYHQDGLRQVNMQLWNWRGLDVINAHERDPQIYREGIRLALAAIASGSLDPTPLYTHRYPLERFGDALNAALERPAGLLKVLIKYAE